MISLPPSSAARRVACPGSRALEDAQPKEPQESEAAREGRIAHDVAIETLKYRDRDDLTEWHETITEDMISGANLFKQEVMANAEDSDILLEFEVKIPRIHENCKGRVDAAYYNPKIKKLHIFDYKYGFKFIDVFENWQLIEYAVGLRDLLTYDNHYVKDIEFVIVQPRSFHRDGAVRRWEISGVALSEEYEPRLINSEKLAAGDNAPCNPSPQCGDCRAKHVCPSLQQTALGVLDTSMSNVPFNMNPIEVGSELRYLKYGQKLLDARIAGLEEEALSLIKKGKNVLHFRAENTVGREIWKKPASEVIALGELMGISLTKPVDVITPKQAVDAGLDKNLVSEYSERPVGALKLVPDDSGRKIFGGKK